MTSFDSDLENVELREDFTSGAMKSGASAIHLTSLVAKLVTTLLILNASVATTIYELEVQGPSEP